MNPILIDRRILLGGALAWGSLAAGPTSASEDDAQWELVKSQIFGDRAIAEDAAPFVSLVAPVRAEDAALVPIDVHVAAPAGDGQSVSTLTLVVDQNPSPLVAKFRLGLAGQAFDLSTRIRINSYSFVRVIAETSDGALHMTKSFVKAAGGCSAPAAKDPDQAKADIGKMRFRVFTGTGRDEAQLQIRHPNYSGMQMNQVTRLYTPAWFVDTLEIRQGTRPVFSMDGGISLSEDPTFRFSYRSDGQPVAVSVKDSQGNLFQKTFPPGGDA